MSKIPLNPDVIKDVSLLFPAISHDSTHPDRIVAIICAAYADKYLGIRLRDAFVGADDSLKNDLLRETGIFGPFANKIKIARALNIIGPITQNDLKLIASIRNIFAHRLDIDSFEHGDVRNLIKNMKIIEFYKSEFENSGAPDFMKNSYNDIVQAYSLRNFFSFSASMICIALSEPYDPTARPSHAK